jgi:hypothetical protein
MMFCIGTAITAAEPDSIDRNGRVLHRTSGEVCTQHDVREIALTPCDGGYPQFAPYAAEFIALAQYNVGNHCVATTSSSFCLSCGTICNGRHVMQGLR